MRSPTNPPMTRNPTATPTMPSTVATDTDPCVTTRTTTVSTTRPMTSSATAAPMTVRASLVASARRSPKTRAAIPTLVAEIAAPMKMAVFVVVPTASMAPNPATNEAVTPIDAVLAKSYVLGMARRPIIQGL